MTSNEGSPIPGIHSISVSLLTHQAVVKFDLSQIKPRKILEEIEDLGFEADLAQGNDQIDAQHLCWAEQEKFRKKMVVSVILYLPMIAFMWLLPNFDVTRQALISFKIWRGVPLSVIVLWALSSVTLFGIGSSFFRSAQASLKHGQANMDVLIALSTSAAYAYGTFLLILGLKGYEGDLLMKIMELAHNFETTSVLIMIVLIGKYIETFSKSKTIDKLSELASLGVTSANLVEETNPDKI